MVRYKVVNGVASVDTTYNEPRYSIDTTAKKVTLNDTHLMLVSGTYFVRVQVYDISNTLLYQVDSNSINW